MTIWDEIINGASKVLEFKEELPKSKQIVIPTDSDQLARDFDQLARDSDRLARDSDRLARNFDQLARGSDRLARDSEQRIVTFLNENQKLTRSQATNILEFGDTKTKAFLNSLLEKGILERRGKGRATHYVLKSMSMK